MENLKENLTEVQVDSLLDYCFALGAYHWSLEKWLPSRDAFFDEVTSTLEVCVRVHGLSSVILDSFVDVYLDAFEVARDLGHSFRRCQEVAHRAFRLHLENGGLSL